MLDAGVDQEENLAVGELAAVMEQDALVAGSALDAEAVLLLVVLEVSDNGVDLQRSSLAGRAACEPAEVLGAAPSTRCRQACR